MAVEGPSNRDRSPELAHGGELDGFEHQQDAPVVRDVLEATGGQPEDHGRADEEPTSDANVGPRVGDDCRRRGSSRSPRRRSGREQEPTGSQLIDERVERPGRALVAGRDLVHDLLDRTRPLGSEGEHQLERRKVERDVGPVVGAHDAEVIAPQDRERGR